MNILIVDDDAEMRYTLTLLLERWKYSVVQTDSAEEALAILAQRPDIALVLTDWSMPEMSGVDLCSRIRETDFGHYLYIIILTANSHQEQINRGMAAGADDFLTKPFDRDELFLRIRAGERIVRLEQRLAQQHQALQESHSRLSEAYNTIKNDLQAAAAMQRYLLPSKALRVVSGVECDYLYVPSAFLAGDSLNFFMLDEAHLGIYAIDAAGHGIPAAMLSMSLHKLLDPNAPQYANVLKQFFDHPPYSCLQTPSAVVRALNSLAQSPIDAMQYFTMIYAVLNIYTGELVLCQAGQPSPVIVRSDGSVVELGHGGFPVGMLPDIDYDEERATLDTGDRLVLYSDGITECRNPVGEMFSKHRFIAALQESRHLTVPSAVQHLHQALLQWSGISTSDEHSSAPFDDDVSLLMLERVSA
jgi:sigma-B regulation protein RsbU (phosphoserine phosphatase)